MLRLFVGIAIPHKIAGQLALMQGGIPGARWTDRHNFHLTLNFIGEVDEATAEIVDEILSSIHVPAFTLNLEGIGNFSQGNDPTVLWAGVSREEKLFRLQEKIMHALDVLHIRSDNRKYTPHVTLARFRRPDDEKVAVFGNTHANYQSEPFDVDSFILYRSHLTKNGPYYDPLIRYSLS